MGKPSQSKVSDSSRHSAVRAAASRTEKSSGAGAASGPAGIAARPRGNPQTACSNCHTVFEVSRELLSTADTRVRCGECLSIFDALANCRDMHHDTDKAFLFQQTTSANNANKTASIPPKSPAFQSTQTNPATSLGDVRENTSLDATYSDFDLFSTDAGLPEIHFFDATRDASDFHFDDVADLGDETFSDTLFAQDVTVDARASARNKNSGDKASKVSLGSDVGFISDEADGEPLEFNYRETKSSKESVQSSKAKKPKRLTDPFEDEPTFDEAVNRAVDSSTQNDNIAVPPTVSNPWWLRLGLLSIVLVIAAGLYGYRERDALLNSNFFRPWFVTACSVLSCQLPDQIDLDALRAVDRSVVVHPTVSNALIIKFGIVNQASFAQPFPVLEIRLTDRAGRLVVRNKFLPSDYAKNWRPGDVLDTNKRLDIGLAVEDPGSTAMSFELDFYEVK